MDNNRQLRKTALLFVIAVLMICVTATYAWFTITDSTNIKMKLDITTGLSFKISLDAHNDIEEYTSSLDFDTIADRLVKDRGFDMRRIPIAPVTTSDGRHFTYQYGEAVSVNKGDYIEFVLHFMSVENLWVHLSENSSRNNEDRTLIWSDDNPDLYKAMRLSFDGPDGMLTYDPLGNTDFKNFSDNSRIVYLPAYEDVPVTVRIWLEGTDPECTNDLKRTRYNIQMRFEATDDDNNPVFDTEINHNNK